MTTTTKTLDEFDAELCEHFGRQVGFAEAWRELRRLRINEAAVKAHADELHGQLKAFAERGATRSGKVELRMTKPSSYTKRVVTATDVKRRRPDLWKACRVPTPRLAVKSPVRFDQQVEPIRLMAVPAGNDLAQTLRVRDAVLGVRKRISAEFAAHKTLLLDMAAELGWDGEQWKFADGWAVQTTTMMFSGDRMLELFPQDYDRMAAKTEVRVASRLYVAEVGSDYFDEQDDDGQRGVG